MYIIKNKQNYKYEINEAYCKMQIMILKFSTPHPFNSYIYKDAMRIKSTNLYKLKFNQYQWLLSKKTLIKPMMQYVNPETPRCTFTKTQDYYNLTTSVSEITSGLSLTGRRGFLRKSGGVSCSNFYATSKITSNTKLLASGHVYRWNSGICKSWNEIFEKFITKCLWGFLLYRDAVVKNRACML